MHKEVQHTYKRSLLAPRRDFIQLAYLLRQDYRTVYDREVSEFPADIQNALEHIREGEPVPEITFSNISKHPDADGRFTIYYNTDYRVVGYWDGDYYVLDYFLLNIERYEQDYCGVHHQAGSYFDLQTAIYRQKGTVAYYCTKKAPDPAHLPQGFRTFEQYREQPGEMPGCLGEVTYDKPLEPAVAKLAGLVPYNNWSEKRNAYAFPDLDLEASS